MSEASTDDFIANIIFQTKLPVTTFIIFFPFYLHFKAYLTYNA